MGPTRHAWTAAAIGASLVLVACAAAVHPIVAEPRGDSGDVRYASDDGDAGEPGDVAYASDDGDAGDYAHAGDFEGLDSVVVLGTRRDDDDGEVLATAGDPPPDIPPNPLEGLGWSVSTSDNGGVRAVMAIDRTYTVRVRLALPPRDPAVAHGAMSDRTVERLLQGCPPDPQNLDLTPAVVVDHDRFAPPSQVDPEFEVRVVDLCATAAGHPAPAAGYGDFDFKLKTLRRPGPATLAISFWDGYEPIDEIVLRLCIVDPAADANACSGHELSMRGAPGSLLVTPDQLGPSTHAIAGLHILNVPTLGAIGAVRLGGSDTPPVTWHMQTSDAAIREQLDQWQKREALAEDEPAEIRNVLFQQAPAAITAAFDAAVVAHRPPGEPLASNVRRPRIWVRYLPPVDQFAPLIFPAAHMASTESDARPLGRSFSVVSSLPPRNLASAQGCIDHWLPIVPARPSDPALATALRASTRVQSRVAGQGVDLKLWPGRLLPLDTSLADATARLRDRSSLPGSVVLMLGHYGNGTFDYFPANPAPGRPTLGFADIRASFDSPSVGIFLMCNSAEPGFNSLAQSMHSAGITTFLLSTKKVRGEAAGTMLRCLLEAVEKAPGAEITIGDAYVAAEACMYEKGFRDEMFAFALAGDSELRLCTPNHPRSAEP